MLLPFSLQREFQQLLINAVILYELNLDRDIMEGSGFQKYSLCVMPFIIPGELLPLLFLLLIL